MKRLRTLVIALAVGLSACGGGGAGNLAAACEGQIELFRGGVATEEEAVMALGPPEGERPPEGEGPPPRPEGTPRPEFVRAMRRVYDERVLPAVTKMRDNAPDEIRDDVERLRQLLTEFRNAPKLEQPGPDGTEQLDRRINAYFYRECPGSKAAVDFADYAFRNLPAELKAGVTRFKFQNVGKEIHDLAFVSRTPKPGVTESLEQILSEATRLRPDQLFEKATVSSGGFALPGETSYALVDLSPGEYVAVCFIAKGSTREKEGEGEAHFKHGMRQDVKVT